MIGYDRKQIEQYRKKLQRHRDKIVPGTVAITLNALARQAMYFGREAYKKGFYNRSKTLHRFITYDPVDRGLRDINRMKSKAGALSSKLGFMSRHEDGGSDRAKGKHGVAVPTGYGAGQPDNQFPIKGLQKPGNRLPRISLDDSLSGMPTRLKIWVAAKKKQRFVFLTTARGTGIYKMLPGSSGRQKIGGRTRKKIQIKRVWNLANRTVTWKARKWWYKGVNGRVNQTRVTMAWNKASRTMMRKYRVN